MKQFYDYYNNLVRLSFEDHPFSENPKHVWVICRYQGKWLLTEHKERGREFPGGKVEEGESASEAAIREVKEETGAVVENLRYVGQYHVDGKGGTIIKNVYFAEIARIDEEEHYFETNGPVVLEELPNALRQQKEYSFMMKDEVLPTCLERIEAVL
ncbi:RNA deprotection pyrophosphohydrolase [Salimicrobium halophilum]|uniref:8-oxo-dGTPase n=1 Tax=Salimicrobium halophilum TaxID=86666 RepID=A0A1G8VBT3_9BACI|nr:nucleoside triphosphatase YtkD [Salimicrobium halophilum]SDJ63551.1 8-oxo-dGTPase [Salimicrobium halophilum]